jgi:dephospho-CoA kinase
MNITSPKIIGITGGIGSGKSLICKIFASFGIPTYEADTRAKLLTTQDPILKEKITQLLGPEAYTPTGEYNRAWIATQVFSNVDLLKKLNEIIHPAVRQDAEKWVSVNSNAPFLLYEAALMKGAGDGNFFQKVIVVNAPIELRIKRVKLRDGRSEQAIRDIIARQISDEERNKFADFIVENDEKTPVIPQVLALFELLKAD